MAKENYQGQVCQRLTLPCGDTVLVALQGAHVLSWVSKGRERLFLSPKNQWDGQSAIRGGVPICFPQFNQRGTLPKHGFARNIIWTAGKTVSSGDNAVFIDFTLAANPETLALWQQSFEIALRVALAPDQLTLTLTVSNTEVNKELNFTGALHTYLAVDDIDLTELRGLGGRLVWDAVTNADGIAEEALYFDGEIDRVYTIGQSSLVKPLYLQDGTSTIKIEQSPSWANSVVWNPGESKCANMFDMTAKGFSRMLCVEAAQVFQPIVVSAGEQWIGWQRLTVA